MEYKVCILSAGKNTNVSYAKDFNISLLPVGMKSALSRIIEKFPRNVEIIIALGYNSNLVKDFVDIAFSDRKINIVEIDDYSAPGSGPGRTLLACKHHLNCPFIFTAADTIVGDEIPIPNKNWIGISQVSDSTNYCMAEVENGFVTKFYDKVETPILLKTCKNYKTILNNAFIGMAGIYEYKTFWKELERDQHLIKKELQVSNGLSGLINYKLEAVPFFNWFDTGNEAGYNFANRFFEKNKIIAKPDEFIYFEDGRVIKYFVDKEAVKQKIARSLKLKNIVPEITHAKDNFYAYDFIEGETLARINDATIFKQFLDFCKDNIWKKLELDQEELLVFRNLCLNFYYNKTIERLQKFFRESDIKDKEEIINGEKVLTLGEMLNNLDWRRLSEGIPVLFHGDLQPENILVCDKGFRLIDWRHNFAGSINYGDIYYDFAKLHHALIVTHDIIRNNQFEIKRDKNYISYDFLVKNNLLEYKDIFEEFIEKEGHDLNKLKILTPLIYLNIAPLHHYPYNEFLYYLGKYLLFKEIRRNNIYTSKDEVLTIKLQKRKDENAK